MLSIIDKGSEKIAILRLTGDPLGESDAELVREKVRGVMETRVLHLVFEMSGVRHINSSGLAGLVAAKVSMARLGGTVQFTNLNKNVLGILDMTRLNTVFDILPTLEEAMKRWETEIGSKG